MQRNLLAKGLAVVGSMFVLSLFIGAPNAHAAACVSNGTGGGNWNAPATWTACGGTFPGSGDTVTIAGGDTVTVNVTSAASALTFANNTVNNNISAVAVGANTLTVTGTITYGSTTGNPNTHTRLTISTGTVNAGSVVFSATDAKDELTFSGVGTLNITSGNFGSSGTLTTVAGSVINFNGSSAQTAGIYTTYNVLKSNNTVGVTLLGASTITTLTIGDSVSSSVFNDGGYVITPGAGSTLNLTSGTYNLGSATVGTAWPAWGTRNIATGTTVGYVSAVAQAVSAAPTYQNLTFSGAGTKTTAAGTTTVAGNWSVTGGTATLNTNNSNFAVTGNITGNGAITSGSGAITLGGNWTNSGTFTAGAGTVNYNGSGSQTVGGVTYNNLTLSGSGAKTAASSTVNGILNLSVANPSSTIALLDTGANTLTMGGSATTIGPGDVTGIVKRTTLIAATEYTFGNQYTSVNFRNVGSLPTDLSVKITIGSAPTWKAGAIQRTYEFVRTGGSGSYGTMKLHYLDSELGSNTENKLVSWTCDAPFASGTAKEFGRSNYDTSNNFVSSGDYDVSLWATNFNQRVGTLGDSLLASATWTGASSTVWSNPDNWSPNGIPSDLSDVIIPNAASTTNDPTLNLTLAVGRLTIESGGILNAAAGSVVTISATSGAWSNNGGTFYPSTSEIIFTNANASMSGATDFYDVTINPGAGLSLTSGGTMRIGGTITNNGTWRAAQLANNTVEYYGAGQTIINPNGATPGYDNLILSGTGTKTSPAATTTIIRGNFSMTSTTAFTPGAAMNVGGNFTVGAGNTFTMGAGNTDPIGGDLTNHGTFTAGAGGTINLGGNFTSDNTFTATGATMTIGGNFTNNNTFTATGSNITFNGTAAQTIGGTTDPVFNILNISNTSSAVTAANNFSTVGTMTVNNGARFDAGTYVVSGGGTFTLASGGTLGIGSSAGIATTGGATGNIQTTVARNYNTGANYDYNGTGAQATGNGLPIAALTGSVTVSNTSTLTATNAITFNGGNLVTQSGTTLNMGTNQLLGNPTVTNNGTIRTQNTGNPPIPHGITWGGTVTYDASGGSQTVATGTYNNLNLANSTGAQITAGDFTVNGTLTITTGDTLNMGNYRLLGALSGIANDGIIRTTNVSASTLPSGKTWGGTVKFDNSGGNQTIVTGTYNNLTIDQGFAVNNATLGGDITVSGTLNLANGSVTTGANTLYVDSTGSVTRTTGYINGNLMKYITTGAVSKTFEVGATYYAPVDISFNNVTGAGDLTIKTVTGAHPNIASSTLSTSKYVNRYWTATNSGITFDNYSAVLNFDSGDIVGGANPNNFQVGKYDTGTWSYPTVGTKNATNTQITGVATGFSDFVVAENGKIEQAALSVAGLPTDANYGDTGITATTTGGSGTGAITFSAGASTACTINSGSGDVTITFGTGTCSITATKAADVTYNATTSDAFSITIHKATPTIFVDNSPVTYDGSAKSATVSSTVAGAPDTILTGGAASQTNANTYAVTANFTPVDGTNYNSLTGALATNNFVISKATPTIFVDNSPVPYDGSPHAATVSSSVAGTPSNIVTGGAGTQTNVGVYAVTADYAPDDSTNYNSLTGASAGNFTISGIDQATLYVTGLPGSAIYGELGITATTTGGSGTGAVTFSAGASTACSIDSGTGVVAITSGTGTCSITATKAADSNYNLATSDAVLITIGKAEQSVLTVTGLPGSAVYLQAGITAGTSGGDGAGAVTYDAGVSTACSVNSGSGAVTITSGSGSCAITATKAADADYNATSSAPFSITIGPAEQSALTVTGLPGSAVYLQAGITAGTSGGDGTGAVTFDAGVSTACSVGSSSGVVTIFSGSGSCDITATKGADANYNATTSVGVSITINKATPTLSVINSPVPYDGAAHAATVSSTVAGTPSNILTGGAASQTTANTYGVTADFAPDDGTDYNSLSGASAGNFIINKVDPILTVDNSPVLYDGAPHAATVTTSVPGVISNISTGGAPMQTNANTYAVTADFAPVDTTDYNSLVGASVGNFVITSATPTLFITNSPVTYNGSSQAADVTSSAPGVVSNVLYDGSGTVPTNAGTYAVTADFVPTDTSTYNSLTGASAGNFVINPVTPTLSVTNSPVPYNGSSQAAAVSGSVAGSVSNVLYDGSGTVPTSVGTYAITANFLPTDATNYSSLTGAAAGNFVITSATPTLSITNSPVIYNGSSQAADVTSSAPGVVSNVLYAGTSTVPTDAGTYAVTADFVPTDTSTYNSLTGASAGNFVINKETVTVTADAKSKAYGAADPAFTYTSSEPAAALTGSLSRVAGESAGTYAITQGTLALVDTANYTLTYVGANLTITGGGGGGLTPAPAVGNGTYTVTIPMGGTQNIGNIGTDGINLLAYINSIAEFYALVSHNNSAEIHSITIISVDLLNNVIIIRVNSTPQDFTLNLGDTVNVDLDSDKVPDISVKLAAINVNRVELTIKSLLALAGTTGQGVTGCPVLASGNMVKVTGKPAIYAVNSALQVLYFPSGDEFKSWRPTYGGYISISQSCYDSLSVPSSYPAAVNYHPGSYIVKRPSSDQLYVVEPNNTLAKITPSAATALYGTGYKVMTIADVFWPHYVNRGADITTATPHQGMLIKVDNATYYVDAGNVLREVTTAGMTANGFQTRFVHTLSGTAIEGWVKSDMLTTAESALTNKTQ